MKIKLGKTVLKNPVMTASGTFGYGLDLNDFFNPDILGGLVTKTVTLKKREGNPPPRIYDLGFGVINSIGLENPGVETIKKDYLTQLKRVKTAVFVSIYGKDLKEWGQLINSLEEEKIAGFELNFSCPNIKGEIISCDIKKIKQIVSKIRKETKKTVLAKLSFSPTIKYSAQAAYEAGADAVTLINTLPAMAIDKITKKPVLGNIVGGLSGPCIKPVALRAVYEVRRLNIPVVGCGGIMSAEDVKEFLSAGAVAVEIGTATLKDPDACLNILKELKNI